MELALVVLLFLALDIVALRWGVDSRQLDDWPRDRRGGWFGSPRDS